MGSEESDPHSPTGLMALIAERIEGLDRRIEDMSRGIHDRLTWSDEHTEKKVDEIKGVQRAAEKERDGLGLRLTGVERTQSFIRGGLVVLSFILAVVLVPIVVVLLDNLV